MRIIDKLQRLNPARNVAFIAIETLVEPQEVRQFFNEYVEVFREKYGDQAEAVAQSNIGYIVGYYNEETANRWRDITGATHPIFGANIPWNNPQAAMAAGEKGNS